MTNCQITKKIIGSSLLLIILLLLLILPNNLKISEEVIYINEEFIPIYTLDNSNYVARTSISKIDNDIIPYIISVLTIQNENSLYLPNGFIGIIPKDTKLLTYTLEDGLLKLNFSKEFLNISKNNEEKLIESLIYSLCELENVDKIMIFVEEKILDKLPNSNKNLPLYLNKTYGINKIYDLDNIKNTTQTTIYYTGKYNDTLYYIPITRISNDNIEPVEIIVNELKSTPTYKTNLISYLNASYELKDYEILEDSINLSFNNKDLANLYEKDIVEIVKYSLTLSIRDTYFLNDVNITIE